MRISTGQIYSQNIRSIMENQRGLMDTQEALSTGKKLNRPSDDPVGAAKVIRFTEELDQLKQYKRNNDLLTGSLEQQEAVLGNLVDTANRARVLAVQAGNGIYSDSDRRALASELEQLRNEAFDLMNSQDADGNYLYAGYQSDTQAFAMNPASTGDVITFQGDGGNSFVQISDSARIQASTSGYEVFQNVLARHDFTVTGTTGSASVNSTRVSEQGTFDSFYKQNYDPVTPANNNYRLTIQAGNNVQLTNVGTGATVGTSAFTPDEPFVIKGMEFNINGVAGDTVDFSLNTPEKKNLAETINDFYQIMRQPIANGDSFDRAINDAIVGIDNAMEKISLERSSVGGRLNAARSVYETNLDLEIAAKEARSSIEDVDYAEASIELSKQETALNAALASFPKVANLSLFNFIS